MIITKREQLQLTPKKIKVSGHYGFKEQECRKAYCKCLPEWRIGEWPNN